MSDPVETLARALFDQAYEPEFWGGKHRSDYMDLARTILPQIVAEAVAKERERCAQICEQHEAGMQFRGNNGWTLSPRSDRQGTHSGEAYAAAIRATPPAQGEGSHG